MNKSWITKSRLNREYNKGDEDFLNFAGRSKNLSGKILCPCKSCINRYFFSVQDVKEHIMTNGFFTGYIVWNRHGEDHQVVVRGAENKGVVSMSNFESQTTQIEQPYIDDIEGLLRDTFAPINESINLVDHHENFTQDSNKQDENQSNLLEDVGAELYPGCKRFSKMSFILHLFRLKCLNSWTARSFDMLLELLIEAFPEGTSLPKTTYEVKKLMKAFDLGYTKRHACPNDCILFWGDKSNENVCEVCGASRWAPNQKSNIAQDKKVQMKPTKIL
ncbi:hypothetical protein KFK09_024052 [Dendrobium nobile]|uniref:Transposase-associated domain-containing protein n=1 Tax=Dendrobium nobile TaxID=94219 RepID=A0A8T3AI74_DENNO|nr:hypothetical protein KFK09_024052 [Dendrobium nobile]